MVYYRRVRILVPYYITIGVDTQLSSTKFRRTEPLFKNLRKCMVLPSSKQMQREYTFYLFIEILGNPELYYN
jgi:hypothetical protein